MKDDAVAPVIAAMLVLAALATFFAVWNATAIPSMKAESEVGHLNEVGEAFSRFSADLANAASLRQENRLEEPVILGGGSVMFNSLTSSGTLRVDEEPQWLYQVGVVNDTAESVAEGRLVNIAYHPVGNFWQDQGFAWHYGFVNVTKNAGGTGADHAGMTSPLNYPSMEEAITSQPMKTFATTLVKIEARPYPESPSNCSALTISAVSFYPDADSAFISGNGIGTLALAVANDESVFGIPGRESSGGLFIRVNRSVPVPFQPALYDACNRSFEKLNRTYPSNIAFSFRTTDEFNETAIGVLPGALPVTVTREISFVNVSVH